VVPKGILDQPVFEGMERDDRGAPAGLQSVGKRRGECLAEMVELLVDGNPQRLEDSRGGMGLESMPSAAGQRIGNRIDEIRGRLHGFLSAMRDDCPCDGAAVTFFPEPEEKGRQLGFVESRQQRACGNALRPIEAHVERPVALKAEAPTVVGKLVGRQSQIEKHAIDFLDPQLVQDFGQLSIAGMLERTPRVREVIRRPLEHHGIAVKTDQFAGWPHPVEEDTAVSPRADSAIDDDGIGPEVEELDDFLDENGTMHGRAAAFRAPHRLRHCGGTTCVKGDVERCRVFATH
jgi:hypothetical protein